MVVAIVYRTSLRRLEDVCWHMITRSHRDQMTTSSILRWMWTSNLISTVTFRCQFCQTLSVRSLATDRPTFQYTFNLLSYFLEGYRELTKNTLSGTVMSSSVHCRARTSAKTGFRILIKFWRAIRSRLSSCPQYDRLRFVSWMLSAIYHTNEHL